MKSFCLLVSTELGTQLCGEYVFTRISSCQSILSVNVSDLLQCLLSFIEVRFIRHVRIATAACSNFHPLDSWLSSLELKYGGGFTDEVCFVGTTSD